MTKKRITICADDFGLSQGVDDAILILAEKRKISAISCLSVSDRWKVAGPRLNNLKHVKTGLHLCLSTLKPLTKMPRFAGSGKMPSLKEVLFYSSLKILEENEIRTEIEAQIDEFIRVAKKNPDFIDGHQHLHQFPVISNIFLEICSRRSELKNVILRNTVQPGLSLNSLSLTTKQLILEMLGRNFKQKVKAKGFKTNSSLSGIYELDKQFYSDRIFFNFLSQIENEGILVCHPATHVDWKAEHDPYLGGRVKEFEYLNSASFPEGIELI